jgi:hypothetical protein
LEKALEIKQKAEYVNCGNSKFIVHLNTNYILPLALLQVIVYILGNNKFKKLFMAAVDLCSFNHGLGIYKDKIRKLY